MDKPAPVASRAILSLGVICLGLTLATSAATQSRGPAADRGVQNRGAATGPAARIGAPLAGVNIIVNRKGGGGMAFVAATSGANGRFSASIQLQPGQYEVFSACQGNAPCISHELVSLTLNGQALPRGENPALHTTHGRGVYTVTAPAAGSQPPPSMAIAGEVRRQNAVPRQGSETRR